MSDHAMQVTIGTELPPSSQMGPLYHHTKITHSSNLHVPFLDTWSTTRGNLKGD